MISLQRVLHVFCLLVLLALPATAFAVDANELIRDTQRMSSDNNQLTLVWWIPEELWRVTLSQEKTVTPEGMEEILKTLRPYTLVAVVDGTIGPMGGTTFRPEAEIRKEIVFVDTLGKEHRPIATDAISSDVQNLLGFMKPVMSNTLGPMGESLYFFAFPAQNDAGKRLADPKSEGTFALKLGKQSFGWKLPLGSLMSPKMCPRDKEVLNGAWSYCPWHGDKLVPAPEG